MLHCTGQADRALAAKLPFHITPMRTQPLNNLQPITARLACSWAMTCRCGYGLHTHTTTHKHPRLFLGTLPYSHATSKQCTHSHQARSRRCARRAGGTASVRVCVFARLCLHMCVCLTVCARHLLFAMCACLPLTLCSHFVGWLRCCCLKVKCTSRACIASLCNRIESWIGCSILTTRWHPCV